MTIDCANGIGAPKMAKVAEILGEKYLSVKLVNTDIRGKGVLNFKVDFLDTPGWPPLYS
jgi:phosphoacetylglucosamine mutase